MRPPLDLAPFVRDIPDFPEPGIVYKDITPLLADGAALATAVARMADPHRDTGITKVVGIEARGFILGAPIALALGVGFVPMRKVGKLPSTTLREEYILEYGSAVIEVHTDAFDPGDRVLIVDDVLATGGTAKAATALVAAAGAEVAGVTFLLEIAFLGGAALLDGIPHTALLSF